MQLTGVIVRSKLPQLSFFEHCEMCVVSKLRELAASTLLPSFLLELLPLQQTYLIAYGPDWFSLCLLKPHFTEIQADEHEKYCLFQTTQQSILPINHMILHLISSTLHK